MIAVWILFVIGIISIIIGLIPAILEAYAFIVAYILTEKELLEKKKQLREEKIRNLKVKDIEVKDNENVKIPEAIEAAEEQPTEEVKGETVSTAFEEASGVTEETVNASEIAKDIVNNI